MPKITHTQRRTLQRWLPAPALALLESAESWQNEISQGKLAKVTECGQTEAINEIKTKEWERERPLPTTFLKGPKLGSLGVFVFGIPGFSLVRSGELQGCQSCQGSGCALRNTNLLTHRAGDCDRQRSATSRKCFQVENSVLFFTPFSFRMRRPFFFGFFLCVFCSIFFLSMLTRKVGKSTLVFLLFYVFILLLFSYSVFFRFCCTASDSFVCFCCVVLFYFVPSICRPLFSPIFYITTPFIISFAKHSHTQLAVLLPLAPCLFFATFPQCFVAGKGGVRGVSTIYTEHIIYS